MSAIRALIEAAQLKRSIENPRAVAEEAEKEISELLVAAEAAYAWFERVYPDPVTQWKHWEMIGLKHAIDKVKGTA